MRILFIGGTSFVGRHAAEEALARGHDVTLFHRGTTGADLFADAEHVFGDRDADLGLLAGRSWEVAIDVCAYVPRQVRQAAEILAGSAQRYCYISSMSAFRSTGTAPITEGSPLLGNEDLQDPQTEVVDGDTYGPLEALCEREAESGFPGRTCIVRPTYVVGPHDPTDRFTYWVRRAALGEEILVPGPPEAPIQLIDARDLGAFIVGLVEAGATDAFNAVGPARPISFAEMVAACMEAVTTEAMLVWADPVRLGHLGVDVGAELPLWRPPEHRVLLRADPSKAIGAGLRYRPLSETIHDTLAWDRDRGSPPLRRAMTPEREREVLTAMGF